MRKSIAAIAAATAIAGLAACAGNSGPAQQTVVSRYKCAHNHRPAYCVTVTTLTGQGTQLLYVPYAVYIATHIGYVYSSRTTTFKAPPAEKPAEESKVSTRPRTGSQPIDEAPEKPVEKAPAPEEPEPEPHAGGGDDG